MSKSANFVLLKETWKQFGDQKLYLQYGRWDYSDGNWQGGYRFIWEDPEGRLIPARGQARLPSLAVAEELIAVAITEGWGHHEFS